MKHFIFVVLLLLTVAVSAQMNIEQVAYIPSRSGFYNNLIVKGNATINNLSTNPFNIVTHGSLTTLNIPNSTIKISQVNVSTGTVSQEGSAYIQMPSSDNLITSFGINGGSLSVSRTPTASETPSNTTLKINAILHPLTEQVPTLYMRTQDFNDLLFANINLYIFGMKYPSQPKYWQPVKIGSKKYEILAIEGDLNCDHPEREEVCLRKNIQECQSSSDPNCWNTYRWRGQTTHWQYTNNAWSPFPSSYATKCECYDTRKDNTIFYTHNGTQYKCGTDAPTPGVSSQFEVNCNMPAGCSKATVCRITSEDNLPDPYDPTAEW